VHALPPAGRYNGWLKAEKRRRSENYRASVRAFLLCRADSETGRGFIGGVSPHRRPAQPNPHQWPSWSQQTAIAVAYRRFDTGPAAPRAAHQSGCRSGSPYWNGSSGLGPRHLQQENSQAAPTAIRIQPHQGIVDIASPPATGFATEPSGKQRY